MNDGYNSFEAYKHDHPDDLTNVDRFENIANLKGMVGLGMLLLG